MRKSIFSILLLTAVLLASCTPQAVAPAISSAPATATMPATISAPAATATKANTAAPVPTQVTGQESIIPTKTAVDATKTPVGPDCQPFNLLEKILSPTTNKAPNVSDADIILGGSPKAPITIIEYSDFQCPYCAEMEPILEQLLSEYPQDVRVIYRYFPLYQIHDKAVISAQAAEAARLQGKFIEMYKALFENQQTWTGKSVDDFKTWVTDQAKTLGLKVDQFTTDMNSADTVAKIKKSEADGETLGVPGTPYLLVNGKQMQVNPSPEVLKAIIDINKIKDRQFTKCPETIVDRTKKYTATLTTDQGDIVIDLLVDKAPIAVNSFVFLAQHGFYDNNNFHRVLTGFVAQTGDPSGTGFGGPGYTFINEVSPDLKFDQPGIVGMANSGPNTNGSQFFISFGPIPTLDGKYTIFGKVISGMDVASKLTPRDPQATDPAAAQATTTPEKSPSKLIKVTIEEK